MITYTEKDFGKVARDKVTGFEGMITGICLHMYGCNTICLVPKVDKDGKVRDGNWFDEGRVEIVGEGIKPEEVRVEKNGAGDNPASTRNHPR